MTHEENIKLRYKLTPSDGLYRAGKFKVEIVHHFPLGVEVDKADGSKCGTLTTPCTLKFVLSDFNYANGAFTPPTQTYDATMRFLTPKNPYSFQSDEVYAEYTDNYGAVKRVALNNNLPDFIAVDRPVIKLMDQGLILMMVNLLILPLQLPSKWIKMEAFLAVILA